MEETPLSRGQVPSQPTNGPPKTTEGAKQQPAKTKRQRRRVKRKHSAGVTRTPQQLPAGDNPELDWAIQGRRGNTRPAGNQQQPSKVGGQSHKQHQQPGRRVAPAPQPAEKADAAQNDYFIPIRYKASPSKGTPRGPYKFPHPNEVEDVPPAEEAEDRPMDGEDCTAHEYMWNAGKYELRSTYTRKIKPCRGRDKKPALHDYYRHVVRVPQCRMMKRPDCYFPSLLDSEEAIQVVSKFTGKAYDRATVKGWKGKVFYTLAISALYTGVDWLADYVPPTDTVRLRLVGGTPDMMRWHPMSVATDVMTAQVPFCNGDGSQVAREDQLATHVIMWVLDDRDYTVANQLIKLGLKVMTIEFNPQEISAVKAADVSMSEGRFVTDSLVLHMPSNDKLPKGVVCPLNTYGFRVLLHNVSTQGALTPVNAVADQSKQDAISNYVLASQGTMDDTISFNRRRNGGDAYTPEQMITDVTKGVTRAAKVIESNMGDYAAAQVSNQIAKFKRSNVLSPLMPIALAKACVARKSPLPLLISMRLYPKLWAGIASAGLGIAGGLYYSFKRGKFPFNLLSRRSVAAAYDMPQRIGFLDFMHIGFFAPLSEEAARAFFRWLFPAGDIAFSIAIGAWEGQRQGTSFLWQASMHLAFAGIQRLFGFAGYWAAVGCHSYYNLNILMMAYFSGQTCVIEELQLFDRTVSELRNVVEGGEVAKEAWGAACQNILNYRMRDWQNLVNPPSATDMVAAVTYSREIAVNTLVRLSNWQEALYNCTVWHPELWTTVRRLHLGNAGLWVQPPVNRQEATFVINWATYFAAYSQRGLRTIYPQPSIYFFRRMFTLSSAAFSSLLAWFAATKKGVKKKANSDRKAFNLYKQLCFDRARQKLPLPDGAWPAICFRNPRPEIPEPHPGCSAKCKNWEYKCDGLVGNILWGIGFASIVPYVVTNCRHTQYRAVQYRVLYWPSPCTVDVYEAVMTARSQLLVPWFPPTTFDFDAWYYHLKPRQRILYGGWIIEPLTFRFMAMHKAFTKRENYLKDLSKIKPRLIQGCFRIPNWFTGPAVYGFTKDFVQFVNEHPYYECPYSKSVDEFTSSLHKKLNFGVKCYVELDGERMDAAIPPEFNKLLRVLLRPYTSGSAGSDQVLAHNFHISGFTQKGVKYYANHGLCSGVQWTTINHCVYMWLALHVHGLPSFDFLFCNKGDDVWIASGASSEVTAKWLDSFRKFLLTWGLTVTCAIRNSAFASEFLAMRPYWAGDDLYWCIKLGRILPKLCFSAIPGKVISPREHAYAVAEGFKHLVNVPIMGAFVNALARNGVKGKTTIFDVFEDFEFKMRGSTIPAHHYSILVKEMVTLYSITPQDIKVLETELNAVNTIPVVVDAREIMLDISKVDVGLTEVRLSPPRNINYRHISYNPTQQPYG
jgi:hypothetical protein